MDLTRNATKCGPCMQLKSCKTYIIERTDLNLENLFAHYFQVHSSVYFCFQVWDKGMCIDCCWLWSLYTDNWSKNESWRSVFVEHISKLTHQELSKILLCDITKIWNLSRCFCFFGSCTEIAWLGCTMEYYRKTI